MGAESAHYASTTDIKNMQGGPVLVIYPPLARRSRAARAGRSKVLKSLKRGNPSPCRAQKLKSNGCQSRPILKTAFEDALHAQHSKVTKYAATPKA